MNTRSITTLIGLAALLAAAPAEAGTVGPNGDPRGPLNRYYDDGAGAYLVTAHRPLGAFEFQTTLGFMPDAPGPGRHAIYSCFGGPGKIFLSRDAGCERRPTVRLEGYLLSTRAPDTAEVYRCNAHGDRGHLASLDAGCEGLGVKEGPLGFAPQRQSALNRYKLLTGEHWVTTRGVTPAYGFEGTLGYVLDTPGADRVALYSCVDGADHYLSGSCSGAFVGYVFTGERGRATRPIYECRLNADRFTSNQPDCGGYAMVGLLGHVLRNPVDDDLDGVGPPADCNDRDASIHPGAADSPDDGIDQNCSGADSVNLDRDRDGIPRPGDCDDARADTYPGAADVPRDGVDQNCDGRDAPYPSMGTTIVGFFTTQRGGTVFTALRLRRAVAGQRVEVRCRGRGCPRKPQRFSVRRSRASLKVLGKLKNQRLRRGAVVEVRVTQPRTIGRAARWEIRAPRNPKRIDRCLPPGSRKAVRC